MGRMSRQESEQYDPLGEEGRCFYCPNPGTMWDFTPSRDASDVVKGAFPDPFVRTRCCQKCWKRIYTVNMVEAGQRYSVMRGGMTLDHKRHLLSHGQVAKAVQANVSYRFGYDKMVVPSDILQIDDKFQWREHTLYEAEVVSLQGPLALRWIGARPSLIELALLSSMNSGELEESRIHVYRSMLDMDALEATYAKTPDQGVSNW